MDEDTVIRNMTVAVIAQHRSTRQRAIDTQTPPYMVKRVLSEAHAGNVQSVVVVRQWCTVQDATVSFDAIALAAFLDLAVIERKPILGSDKRPLELFERVCTPNR